ncbi:uncharacterized protein [Leptinotarsa decemlineata]|uniref:uncharacterized protein n=1 Tax=Leptinotarsa decemlineata TaxID=7539 RepID=UPI003D308463
MVKASISSRSSSLEFSEQNLKRKRSFRQTTSCRAYETPNFIAKNIRTASQVKKIEYDSEENEISSLRSSVDSWRNSRFGNSRIKSNGKLSVDLDYSRGNVVALQEKPLVNNSPKTSLRFPETQRENFRKYSNDEVKYSKLYIKQTTCPACMEKWKTPLPPPKTPKVNNAKVIPAICNQLVKTDSKVRVQELIHKEKNVLETYDRKFSSSSESSRRNSKKNDSADDSPEYVKVNPLELARIKQEEREKETRKKLEKFLKSPI